MSLHDVEQKRVIEFARRLTAKVWKQHTKGFGYDAARLTVEWASDSKEDFVNVIHLAEGWSRCNALQIVFGYRCQTFSEGSDHQDLRRFCQVLNAVVEGLDPCYVRWPRWQTPLSYLP